MIGRQHLDFTVTKAVDAAVTGPDTDEMRIGQHEARHGCADRCHATGRRLIPDQVMRLVDGVTQGMHPFGRGQVRFDRGDHVGDQPTGIVARLVPAHAIGHDPDILLGQSKNRVLVHFSLETDMTAGAETDLWGNDIHEMHSLQRSASRSNKPCMFDPSGKPLQTMKRESSSIVVLQIVGASKDFPSISAARIVVTCAISRALHDIEAPGATRHCADSGAPDRASVDSLSASMSLLMSSSSTDSDTVSSS